MMWRDRPFPAFLLLVVVLLPAIVTYAQPEPPGGVGLIIEGNPGGSNSLTAENRLACSGRICRLDGLLFPTLFGIDPATANFAPGADGGLAERWDISEDNKVYTVLLRDDLRWSDDTPVTAWDVLFTYRAILDDRTGSDRREDIRGAVADLMVVDDYTVEITFKSATCNGLSESNFRVAPAHAFDPEFAERRRAAGAKEADDVLDIVADGGWITAGTFGFNRLQNGEWVSLNGLDARMPSGFLYLDVANADQMVDRFITGELNFIENSPLDRRDDIRQMPGAQVFDFPGNTWVHMALNLADPLRPQSAFDEDGYTLEQGHHPLFADVRVRRALQMAIDLDALIDGAVYGEGTGMLANQLPTSWVFDPALEPVKYDPVRAANLLAEAGWFDANRDSVIECFECLYAQNGRPFSFTLYSVDSGRQYAAALNIQEQLHRIGIRADVSPVDFESLLRIAQSQTFDAYILGWAEEYPDNPDQSDLFSTDSDQLFTNWNTVSYSNPELDALMVEANALPGCDSAERAERYRQIQHILQQDQPYIWLYVTHNQYAAGPSIHGFDPYPNAPFWNVRDWIVYP